MTLNDKLDEILALAEARKGRIVDDDVNCGKCGEFSIEGVDLEKAGFWCLTCLGEFTKNGVTLIPQLVRALKEATIELKRIDYFHSEIDIIDPRIRKCLSNIATILLGDGEKE